MVFNNVTLTGSIRVTRMNGTTEVYDKILQLDRNIKVYPSFYKLFLFDFPNGVALGKNMAISIPISNALMGVGDGTNTNFTYDAQTPIKANTVTVKTNDGTNDVTLTDDGSGNITGTGGSGTVDYATGQVSVTFDTAPAADKNVLISYTIGQDNAPTPKFDFALATDATPDLTDNTAFANLVSGLSVTPESLSAAIDWYQTETEYVYEILLNGTYSGAETDKITALQISYKELTGTALQETLTEKILMKSDVFNKTNLFGQDGMKLGDSTSIELLLDIKIRK